MGSTLHGWYWDICRRKINFIYYIPQNHLNDHVYFNPDITVSVLFNLNQKHEPSKCCGKAISKMPWYNDFNFIVKAYISNIVKRKNVVVQHRHLRNSSNSYSIDALIWVISPRSMQQFPKWVILKYLLFIEITSYSDFLSKKKSRIPVWIV
jgi:hypothetical protein